MPFDFHPQPLDGLVLIQPKVFGDPRGYFLESYKRSEFEAAGIPDDFLQDNISLSTRGVLRGLHYQLPPHAQGKLVGAAVGEEKRGSLDLLLSNPVSRSGVVVPKSLVALAGTVIIGFGTWLTVIGVAAMLGEDASNLDVFSASMMLIGLAVMFGGLAAAVAGWTGRSGAGIGIATGVAAVSWFATSVLSIEPSLETLSTLTPWYLYSGSEPIFNGIGWWQLAVMVGTGIALGLLGVVGVNRRDLKG